MPIAPFDEHPAHRAIVAYDPAYAAIFRRVKRLVESRLRGIQLFHIGSTAVPDLRGKPMVDIVALVVQADLRAAQRAFEGLGFQRREVWTDTDDKPYVCGSVESSGITYNVNVHLVDENHPLLESALSLVAGLQAHADLRRRYEAAKDHAHALEPTDPERYNRAKEGALVEIQQEVRRRS